MTPRQADKERAMYVHYLLDVGLPPFVVWDFPLHPHWFSGPSECCWMVPGTVED